MKRFTFMLLFLGTLLLLTACTKASVQGAAVQVPQASSDANNDGVIEFKLLAPHAVYTFYDENGKILPFGITVKKGDRVRFLATSDLLKHNHGVTIDEYGINEIISTEDEKNPKVIEFTADKSGTFRIWCKTCLTGIFGPHPGMEATLDVE